MDKISIVTCITLGLLVNTAFSCDLYLKNVEKSSVIQQQAFPAISWGDGNEFMVIKESEGFLRFCIFQVNTDIVMNKCFGEMGIYENINYHDIDWVGDRVFYVEGFDDGGNVGYVDTDDLREKVIEKQNFDDIFGFSVAYDPFDGQVLITQADGIGSVVGLNNGELKILEEEGFDAVASKSGVWYSGYKYSDSGRLEGIGGILKVDRNTSSKKFVTDGRDKSPTLSDSESLFFIRDEGQWIGKRIYMLDGDGLCQITHNTFNDLKRIKVNRAGDKILVIEFREGLFYVNLLRLRGKVIVER